MRHDVVCLRIQLTVCFQRVIHVQTLERASEETNEHQAGKTTTTTKTAAAAREKEKNDKIFEQWGNKELGGGGDKDQ